MAQNTAPRKVGHASTGRPPAARHAAPAAAEKWADSILSKWRTWPSLDRAPCDECGRDVKIKPGANFPLCDSCAVKRRRASKRKKSSAEEGRKNANSRKRPAIYLGQASRGKRLIRESNRRELREIADMRRELGMPAIWRDGDWHDE